MKHFWLFPLAIFLSLCTENEPSVEACRECSVQSAYDTLDDVYLQVTNVMDTIWVTQIDSVSNSAVDYAICPDSELESVEYTKIIKASGSLHHPCDVQIEASFFHLDTFSVVETCLPKIDTLEGESSLTGKWLFYEIKTELGSFILPCEAGEAYLTIKEDDDSYLFGGSSGTNVFQYTVLQVKSDTIVLSGGITTLAFPPTQAGLDFERAVSNLFGFNNTKTSITYDKTNNFLILQNIDNPATGKFFKTD